MNDKGVLAVKFGIPHAANVRCSQTDQAKCPHAEVMEAIA